MDYHKFIQELSQIYDNWGDTSMNVKSEQLRETFAQVKVRTNPNIMGLINLAVEHLEDSEMYCQIGCDDSGGLIGAILNHPEETAYAVDIGSNPDTSEERLENLLRDLEVFNLEDSVIYCPQSLEEFFLDLREIAPETKIGVYYYDGASDYRSQFLGLLLVRPFLAEQALIIINNSNYSMVQQASLDFLMTYPESDLVLDLSTASRDHYTFGNGLYLITWDVNRSENKLLDIQEILVNNPVVEAIGELHNEFEFFKKPNRIKTIKKEGLAFQMIRQFDQAIEKYTQALKWNSLDPYLWSNLGILYSKKDRFSEALKCLEKALKLEFNQELFHYNIGLILGQMGGVEQAIKAYKKAIEINPDYLEAYINLANEYCRIGEKEQAINIFEKIDKIYENKENKKNIEYKHLFYYHYGNFQMEQRNIEEAIKLYQKASQLKPYDYRILEKLGQAYEAKQDLSQAYLNFAYTAFHQGQFKEAIEYWQQYLQKQRGTIPLYLNLANSYEQLNDLESAIKVYQEALEYYPDRDIVYFYWIKCLQNFGLTEEAIKIAEEGLSSLPQSFLLKLEQQRILPIIYEKYEDIAFYRNRFANALNQLVENHNFSDVQELENSVLAVARNTNFYLQYQGQNDIKLQSIYGQFVHKIMSKKYPQWVKPLTLEIIKENEKIRLGYVSAYLRNHNGANWALGWIKNANREQFEIYSYYTDYIVDNLTKQFDVLSDHFYYLNQDLEPVCEQIIQDKLHIIVYPEIGMCPQTLQIAALRLAPIQCTAWGHPVTSGLPTVDYYLSSNLMEPENAQSHYSEQLIRLPNIGLCYPKPQLPKIMKNRNDFHLRENAIIYLSCQSLFKYLPQYDYIFPRIALNVPEAQFVFLGSPINIPDKFQKRLQKAFAEFGLNSEDYCIMLPRLYEEDYLRVNLLSDIYLDTLGWNGGNTTMKAIACGLPIVTCPKEFMRGRHSYGILKMLGVEDTIAYSESEYIEIAVRLGSDLQWRQSVIEKIKANEDRIYDDKTCVKALEDFFRQLVNKI